MKIYKYILIFAFLFVGIIFAQGKKIIDIRDFNGVFTNADLEDIPKENFVELKNLRPVNGKLVKTFGFGSYGYDSVSDVDNIVTYINSNLTNPDDYARFVYIISDDSVYLQYWNTSTSNWTTETLTEQLYHKDAQNPIVQEGGIIRFLPGNVGSLGGNEAKGLWYGYIDSLWVFDQNYQRTAGFYDYPTSLSYIGASPDLTFTPAKLDSGEFSNVRYYKYTWIFDGVQETLLNDAFNVNFTNDEFLKLDISFIPANLNLRIDGMNIYRSDGADEIYYIIHAIDFLRDSSDVVEGDSAWNGNYYIYVPDLVDYSFNSTYWYEIDIEGSSYEIKNPGAGDGYETFKDTSTITTAIHWNEDWLLYESTDGINFDGVQSGENGAFYGYQIAIIDTNLGASNYSGGVFCHNLGDSIEYRLIDKNYQRALGFTGDSLRTDSARSWRAVSVGKGNYFYTRGTSYDTITFFDTGLTEGAEHPLVGEVSIKVNGKYAKIIGQRLWQANLILDPGGKNEIRTDWVSYSELGQYDVNSVSNVISFANEGVGEITGIAELWGNPVVMKKNNMSVINIKSYPVTPMNWNIIESVHNVGNIADNGYITVLGKLYTCSYDGIYEFAPNDLAESAQTPSKRLKITEPIEDTYLALTLAEKEAIVSEYNQKYNEILFVLGEEVWVFNVNDGDWREITYNIVPTIMALDDTANVMAYWDFNNLLYYTGKNGDVSVELKTKTFAISDERKEIVRYAWITYLSNTELTLNFFGEDTFRTAFSLPVNSVVNTYKLPIGWSAEKFYLSIMDSVSSNTNTEIHRLKIEYEGEQQ